MYPNSHNQVELQGIFFSIFFEVLHKVIFVDYFQNLQNYVN